MKDVKRFLVYYNETDEVIGFREHHFDWEEGDVITTNGRQTVIFGIFTGTPKNMSLVRRMIDTLKRYLPKKKWTRVFDEDFKFQPAGDFFEGSMDLFVHSHYELVDVRTKVWKDIDAQLDFVDSIFEKMED